MKMQIKYFWTVAAAVFLLCANAVEKQQDTLREKAQKGDPEAAFYLGSQYFYGEKRLNYVCFFAAIHFSPILSFQYITQPLLINSPCWQKVCKYCFLLKKLYFTARKPAF